MKDLVILTGPTAVGKTALSIALAKKIGGEIISADSMQIYKGMDIGTAKIKTEEMDGIPHYMVDEFEPDYPFNVTVFKEKVDFYIQHIKSKGKIPILVGGTGFYIQAVLYDIHFAKTSAEDEIRAELDAVLKEKGAIFLHEELKKVDFAYAMEVSPNNTKKVIRALSFFKATGTKLSEHNQIERGRTSPYDFSYFVLTMDRQKIYERINQRVDKMLEEGLVEEVKALADKGYHEGLISMKGIGYKEVFPYLRGEISLSEMSHQIKINTRHFAKRQLTWFKREKVVTYVDKDEYSSDEACLDFILSELNK